MTHESVRYEPDEKAPTLVAVIAALQAIAAMVMTTTLIPAFLGHHAGLPENHIQWMLFASLMSAAIIAAVQTLRFGRLGGGLVMLGGAAPAFIGVSELALSHGGIPLLSVLSLCSVPMVLVFARYAHHFRRILRPPVMGTLLMLVAVSLAQAVWRTALQPHQEGTTAWPSLAVTGITFGTIVSIFILARGKLRNFAPMAGLMFGLGFVWMMGATPPDSIEEERLLGIPAYSLDYSQLSIDGMFLALLPAFLILQIVTAMESFSCSRLSRSLSYRKSAKPDQRVGQGAVMANGVGTLVAAALGSLPTTTYSSSISVLGMTGIMSRRVGYWAGLILFAVALSPQLVAFIVHFPAPVAAGYLLFIVVLIFNNGVRMATEGGLDAQEGIIVFTGFWTGVTLQTGLAGAHLGQFGAVLSSSGTAIGGVVTFLLILLIEKRMGDRCRLHFRPTSDGFAELSRVVSSFTRRLAASSQSATRLNLGCEEATQLLLSLRQANPEPWPEEQISLSLRVNGSSCQVELMTHPTAGDFEELELRAQAEIGMNPIDERLELASFRILSLLATDIRHVRYHDVDVLSFNVAIKSED
jgi:xanthine/uracil permease